MDRFEDRIIDEFEKGAERMKGHSDRIRAIETESDTHVALPPVTSLTQAPAPAADPKPALPWWAIALATAILTYLGPKVFVLLIDVIAKLNHTASTP